MRQRRSALRDRPMNREQHQKLHRHGARPGARLGVILMHGTYPWSFEATKQILDPKTGYLKAHGFKLATVEDAICWKYGKHSWDIVKELSKINKVPN